MKSSVFVSIVVPTIGRVIELEEFLISVKEAEYNENIEIIIVDQNEKGFLNSLVEKYTPFINIKHFVSERKGASLARNIGLQYASYELINFCDDDAVIEKDFIQKIERNMADSYDMVSFRVVDIKKEDENCMIPFPSVKKKICFSNIEKTTIEISQIWRKKSIRNIAGYDERLGVGTYFSSDESMDLIIRALKENYVMWYFPEIGFRHPNKKSALASRYLKYARGTGALHKKHWSRWSIKKKFIVYMVKNMVGVVVYNVWNPKKTLKHIYRVFGFFQGFLKF